MMKRHADQSYPDYMYLCQEERRQVEEADALRRAKAEKVVQRSEEEQRERARLLGEYGYDSDPVDEDGNPLPPEEAEGGEGNGVRCLRCLVI